MFQARLRNGDAKCRTRKTQNAKRKTQKVEVQDAECKIPKAKFNILRGAPSPNWGLASVIKHMELDRNHNQTGLVAR